MRARASAVFLLFVTLLGLTLGPYFVGRLSDHWDGNLRLAFMASTVGYMIAFVLFLMAARTIAQDEDSRFDRARAALGINSRSK
jgi:MFS family permease